LHEFAAHKLGVNALAAVEQQHKQQQHTLLLSAGKDHSLRLWEIQAGAAGKAAGKGSSSSSSSARCVVKYEGHKEAVQAVGASPGGGMCCSGGWDGQLLLWRTGELAAACWWSRSSGFRRPQLSRGVRAACD
jgi:WD40 repeat protein